MAFFFFGTLRDPDVLAMVLDRPLHANDCIEARITGHRIVVARDHPWPLLVRAAECTVTGTALLDPSARDEQRLTWFEEDEYVARWRTIQIGDARREARVFFAMQDVAATDTVWDFTRWRRDEKTGYLRQCAEWLRELDSG